MSETDRIEKQVLLRAPRERVWRAVSEAARFGAWFGVRFDGQFAPGAKLTGRIAPTQVDEQVAALQKPYEGYPFEFMVDRVEPMDVLSFRWHPYAIDTAKDYSSEPMTRVTFTLADDAGGTLLTITESGFDSIPLERRAQAFTANDGGWAHQCKLVEKYVASPMADAASGSAVAPGGVR
jgi:uncharacterized protein YndB with AHSA1/START domain